MRKVRSFEENTVQNLQIEQQFQKLMQIEGLDKASERPKEPFPSLKDLFHNNTMTSIIGTSPNANIRAFNYLLLCHIRKVHLQQLLSQSLKQQVERLSSQDEGFSRDRKVSFTGKGAVFLNGPQYQNYALHKLRIYAFSKSTDLSIIKNTPLENDKSLWYKSSPMNSLQMKKLLSQFLKQLLPEQMPKQYKKSLKSVRYYLNRYKVVGMILQMVMRNVLYSNYEIQSAQSYQQEVNDHTVCTTLCDAFAIDGLMCQDNLYEINTWCKVYSIFLKKEKIIFVEMFNDEFQEIGIVNQRQEKQTEQEDKQWIKEQHSPSFQQFQICQFKSQSVNISDLKSESAKKLQSEASNSVMDKDEDSQIQSQNSNSSLINSSNKGKQSFSSEKEAKILDQEDKNKKGSENDFSIQSRQQRQYEEVRTKLENFLKANSFRKKSEQKVQKTEPTSKQSLMSNYNKNSGDKRATFKRDCTPSTFFEEIGVAKPKPREVYRANSQEEGSNIINNNISNNIYLNLGDSPQYRPVINISTSKKDPKGININLG